MELATRFFNIQRQAETKQHPETELLTKCPKKQVCLYQWCYIINCNENDNDNGNGKIDHINKIYIDQDVDIGANIQNIVCLGKTLPQCCL